MLAKRLVKHRVSMYLDRTMKKSELKDLTKRLGGVRAAANNLGVSTQAVYQWLNGQRPVPQTKADQLRTLVTVGRV